MQHVESITLSAGVDITDVQELLEDQGIVVLPQYLDVEMVQRLNNEFDRLFEEEPGWIQNLDYAAGRACSLDKEGLDNSSFEETRKLFNRPMMHRLAEDYFDGSYDLNSEIYVTHDLPREHNINELHFDRLETLKFFFYLKDTTVENGAFACVPSSHTIAQRIREQHLRKGGKVIELPNKQAPETLGDPVPVEGPAGTLIIFTTDVYHRGGQVSKNERRVMRGHTRSDPPPTYNPSPLSPHWRQWLRQSWLNPRRYLEPSSSPLE